MYRIRYILKCEIDVNDEKAQEMPSRVLSVSERDGACARLVAVVQQKRPPGLG